MKNVDEIGRISKRNMKVMWKKIGESKFLKNKCKGCCFDRGVS